MVLANICEKDSPMLLKRKPVREEELKRDVGVRYTTGELRTGGRGCALHCSHRRR